MRIHFTSTIEGLGKVQVKARIIDEAATLYQPSNFQIEIVSVKQGENEVAGLSESDFEALESEALNTYNTMSEHSEP